MNAVQQAAKLYEYRDTMAAGIRMARMVDGMDAIMIVAAMVELVEPSN